VVCECRQIPRQKNNKKTAAPKAIRFKPRNERETRKIATTSTAQILTDLLTLTLHPLHYKVTQAGITRVVTSRSTIKCAAFVAQDEKKKKTRYITTDV
jgi:hypothetical protein